MGSNFSYSRPVRMTASGTLLSTLSRPVTISGISARPAGLDLVVRLRDRNSGGSILWELEADNAAGSHYESHNPPLYFPNGCYVEIVQGSENASICFAVIEPYTKP